MAPSRPSRKLRLDIREDRLHAPHHVQQICVRRDVDGHADRAQPVEGDVGLVILGTEDNGRDVSQPDHRAAFLLDHELLEFLERLKARRSGHVDLDHLALGVAEARDVVVGGERGVHVCGRQAVGGELGRIEPGAQREIARAEERHGLHTLDRLELRLHHTHQIIGDLIGLKHLRAEAEIHRRNRLADLHLQRGLLRLRRQSVQHRAHLAGDLGHRAVVVVVEPEIDRDRRDAVGRGRGDVVDAVGLGDGRFQRLGDEPRHDVGIRAVIERRHRHDGVFRARILPHRKRQHRAQADHQDQQTDHGCQHRPLDEDIGETHRLALTSREVADSGRWSAARRC